MPEYLKLLQESTQHESSEVTTDQRSFDAAHFWRRAYQHLVPGQAENIGQSDMLPRYNKSRSLVLTGLGNDAQETKRKQPPVQTDLPPKRTRGQFAHLPISDSILSESQHPGSFRQGVLRIDQPALCLTNNSDPTPLARYLFEFGLLLRLQPPPVESLTTAIISSCVQADATLSSIVGAVFSSHPTGEPPSVRITPPMIDMKDTLTAIKHIVRISTKLLGDLPVSEALLGKAIYSIVALFNTMLDVLHNVALSKARASILHVDDRATNLAARQQKVIPGQSGENLIIESQNWLGIITNGLVVFLESLQPLQAAHKSLMEGISCIFLEYVGNNLSILSFSDQGMADDVVVHSSLLLPMEIQYSNHQDRKVAKVVASEEAPYLIFILEKLVSLFKIYDAEDSKNDATFLGPKGSDTAKSGFLEGIQTKLQNTLLRGAFGESNKDFLDSLKPPARSTTSIESASPSFEIRKDSPEWFVERVWTLIGWEVLAKTLEHDEEPLAGNNSTSRLESFPGRGNHTDISEASSVSSEDLVKYCYCRDIEHGKMVKCDGPACPFERFHLGCVGLRRMPNKSKSWLCGFCKNIR